MYIYLVGKRLQKITCVVCVLFANCITFAYTQCLNESDTEACAVNCNKLCTPFQSGSFEYTRKTLQQLEARSVLTTQESVRTGILKPTNIIVWYYSGTLLRPPLIHSHPVYSGHSPWSRLHRHSELQYLRNPCFAATSLLRITASFRGPNCMQTICNNPYLADTFRRFLQDCPPSLLQLITCRQISAVIHSTSLPSQRTAKESSENAATLCSTARLCIPRLPEMYRKPLSWGHLSIRAKMLVPNGVRY